MHRSLFQQEMLVFAVLETVDSHDFSLFFFFSVTELPQYSTYLTSK